MSAANWIPILDRCTISFSVYDYTQYGVRSTYVIL